MFDYMDDPQISTGVSIAWADINYNSLVNAIHEVSSDESWLKCGYGLKNYNEKMNRVEVELR